MLIKRYEFSQPPVYFLYIFAAVRYGETQPCKHIILIIKKKSNAE